MFNGIAWKIKSFFSNRFFFIRAHEFVVTKLPAQMFIVKTIENNTRCARILRLFSCSTEVILASFTSSTVSVHSSTNLLTIFFLHLQFP